MLGENIENQLCAIDDAGADGTLNIALLGGREIVVKEDDVGGNGCGCAGDFLQFSLADQRGRIGAVTMLHELARDFGARAEGEGAKFVERFLGTEVGGIRLPA